MSAAESRQVPRRTVVWIEYIEQASVRVGREREWEWESERERERERA